MNNSSSKEVTLDFDIPIDMSLDEFKKSFVDLIDKIHYIDNHAKFHFVLSGNLDNIQCLQEFIKDTSNNFFNFNVRYGTLRFDDLTIQLISQEYPRNNGLVVIPVKLQPKPIKVKFID